MLCHLVVVVVGCYMSLLCLHSMTDGNNYCYLWYIHLVLAYLTHYCSCLPDSSPLTMMMMMMMKRRWKRGTSCLLFSSPSLLSLLCCVLLSLSLLCCCPCCVVLPLLCCVVLVVLFLLYRCGCGCGVTAYCCRDCTAIEIIVVWL
jgi:hypothetical protein